MKGLPRYACIIGALLTLTTGIVCAGTDDSPLGGAPNPDTQKMAGYIKHLGEYFGYDLTKDSQDILKIINAAITSPQSSMSGPVTSISQQLLDLQLLQGNEQNLTQTYLGAMVNTTTSAGTGIPLVPSSTAGLNQSLNATYPSFGQPSNDTGRISVLQDIDQKPYQNDPVSQTLINLLTTPPDKATSNNLTDKLELIHVVNQAIAPPTKPKEFFDVTSILQQLNSDTLISPLMYSTQSNSSTTSSPPADNSKAPKGLPTQNTAQLAADFIRYVSGTVLPITLPSYNSIGTTPAGQALLAQYMANLRIYAAQVSVGLGNLYYLLSKRLPQPGANNSPPTSQALSEYNMATWRLVIPNTPGGNNPTQWQNALNGASVATVQKEIATLLAEINYQLYLSRQQQERLLLTNTTLLLLSARTSAPSTASLIPGNTPGAPPSSSSSAAPGRSRQAAEREISNEYRQWLRPNSFSTGLFLSP